MDLDKCGRALDIGCGTRRVLTWFSDKCRTVVELDASIGMLRVAKKKLRGRARTVLLLGDPATYHLETRALM